jgi:DNA repair and recombination protein RAD52
VTAAKDVSGVFSEQVKQALDQPLDLELVKSRKGDRGRDVQYIEGHVAISQLNRIFGYDRWGYTIDAHGVYEHTEGPVENWYALYWAQVTLNVQGSLPRTDLGRIEVRNTLRDGKLTNNVRNVDQCSLGLVGAVTDALKRAARSYGEQFGNGLYDKDGNVYPWMEANRVESDEEKAVRLERLRLEVTAGLEADQDAAGKLPKPVDEMNGDELAKCLDWLQKRVRRAV